MPGYKIPENMRGWAYLNGRYFCKIERRDGTLVFRVLRFQPDDRFSVVDSFIVPKMRK